MKYALASTIAFTLGVVLSGCQETTGSPFIGSTGTGSTAATVASGSSTWDPPEQINQVASGSVTALSETSSGDVLIAHSPSNEIEVVDGNGQSTIEMGFANDVSSFVEVSGEVFAATSDPYTPDSGDVYVRDPAGWRLVLDTPHSELVLAEVDGFLYAISSDAGAGSPVINVRFPGTTQWKPRIGLLPEGTAKAAVGHDGELWVGGTNAAGDAMLYRGTWTGLMQLPISGNVVTALASTPDGTLVAVEDLDSAGRVVGGRVLLHDGLRAKTLISFTNTAPSTLASYGKALFVGTRNGELYVRSEGSRRWLRDHGLTTNGGVRALLALDAETLLVGVTGANGAELHTRRAVTAPTATVGGGAGMPLDYLSDVKPALANCVGCHSTMPTGFMLSAGLADDMADYQATLGKINQAAPDASLLLTKATNSTPHVGGPAWAVGSSQHSTVLRWINDGAVYDKSTLPTATAAGSTAMPAPPAALPPPVTPPPAPPPPAPPPPAKLTYLTDARPLLLTCATVGCHATKTQFRVSAGLVNNASDYQAMLNVVDLGNPTNSKMLTKPTSTKGHPVKVFNTGSPTYNTLLKWIQDGAPYN